MVIKCKMCGGQLNIDSNTKIIECDYCGSTQTLPAFDNEKKSNLFNRANNLRLNKEFDKAIGVYESLVAEFPEEAEAYWGLCLCKYGVEYVDDPKTCKKIPTCHRTSNTSILNDDDYIQVCENADILSRNVYLSEAAQIDEIQKQIHNIVSKEEPYDIFICYKETDDTTHSRTEDSSIAQDIYTELVKEGYRVFFSRISLRDRAGTEYEPYIYAALSSAIVMLAIGTKAEYYDAVWVKNEWSRYLSMMAQNDKKVLIPCYKNIDAYDMPVGFKNLQALDISDVTFFKNLLININRIIPKAVEQTTAYNKSNSFDTNNPSKEIALPDGGLYVGEALAGKPHGKGTCIYEKGDKYEGDWAFGKFNGKGKYISKCGTNYDGEWQQGKYHGEGQCHYSDNSFYEGHFVGGKKAGNGKLTRADGTIWEGLFVQDNPFTGSGIYIFNEGSYDGKLESGKKVGHGIFQWKNGDRWQGEFQNDKPFKGKGKWHYSDGNFEGSWNNGARNGKGIFYFSTDKYAERFEGTWVNDTINGQGTTFWKSGETLTAEWKNDNIWSGEGKRYYNDGYFIGRWVDGNRTGKGSFIGDEHSKYTSIEEIWKDDQIWKGTAYEKRENKVLRIDVKNGGWVYAYDGPKGCYIATCVYGSYDCPAVWTLRRYRDDILAGSWFGRVFIHCYYHISPFFVKIFGKQRWFKNMWKTILDPFVTRLNNSGIDDTPYNDQSWK